MTNKQYIEEKVAKAFLQAMPDYMKAHWGLNEEKIIFDFIHQAIAEREREIVEMIEKLRKINDPYDSRGDAVGLSYNQALSDIKALLTNGQTPKTLNMGKEYMSYQVQNVFIGKAVSPIFDTREEAEYFLAGLIDSDQGQYEIAEIKDYYPPKTS